MLPLLEQAGPVGYELPAELGKVSGSNAGGGDGEQARVCLKCDVATQTSPSLKRKREATAQGFPGGGLPAGIAARENSPTMRQPTLRQVAQLPSLLLPHSLVLGPWVHRVRVLDPLLFIFACFIPVIG